MGHLLPVPTTTCSRWILFLAMLRCCSSTNSTNSTFNRTSANSTNRANSTNTTASEEDFTAAMKLTAYRNLQYPDRAPDAATLHFSLWFPTQNDPSLLDVDSLMDDTQNPSLGVMQALERLLCQETHKIDATGEGWIMTEYADSSGGITALQTYNVCQRYPQLSASSSSSSNVYNAPSILYRYPTISVLKTTQETETDNIFNIDNETAASSSSFAWTVWSLQYRILQVGDVFVQEAIMNNADLLISEIQDAAVTAMQEVIQLTLEVAIMEGQFDELLHDELPTVAYSALVGQELLQWQAAQIDFETSYSFTPGTWYPMRIAGLALWTLTLATYMGLYGLSHRRRRRRQLQMSKPQQQSFDARRKQSRQQSPPQTSQRRVLQHSQPSHSMFQPVGASDDEQVQLVHPASVDQMLHQSSLARHLMVNDNNNRKNSSHQMANQYLDSAWDELPRRVQEAAMILGYTARLWNQKQRSPLPCESKAWRQLTVAEQQAAAVFGFNQGRWDDVEEMENPPFVVS